MVESPAPPADQGCQAAVLPPHPPITGAYKAPEGKRAFLDALFDDTAQDYDRVEHWLSFGSGRRYRRQALQRAGLQRGMRVADVAVGTGLVAGEALAVIGPSGKIVGIDPSLQMRRRAAEHLGIETVAGTAESVPFPAASFDFLSMGYALRHVEDLNGAFREFHRVLAPGGPFGGGRLCVLELTRPQTRVGRAGLRLYLATLSRLLGAFGGLAPRTPELWAYYWETIDKCQPPERVLEAVASAGFSDVRRNVVIGLFSEYTAVRV